MGGPGPSAPEGSLLHPTGTELVRAVPNKGVFAKSQPSTKKQEYRIVITGWALLAYQWCGFTKGVGRVKGMVRQPATGNSRRHLPPLKPKGQEEGMTLYKTLSGSWLRERELPRGSCDQLPKSRAKQGGDGQGYGSKPLTSAPPACWSPETAAICQDQTGSRRTSM